MDWQRLKRRLGLFVCGQLGLMIGAVLIAWEPLIGIIIALFGVAFHAELILDLYSPRDPHREGKPA